MIFEKKYNKKIENFSKKKKKYNLKIHNCKKWIKNIVIGH